LVGLKNFIWPFDFFWPRLEVVDLKKSFGRLAPFRLFYAAKNSTVDKYLLFHFFGNTFENFFR